MAAILLTVALSWLAVSWAMNQGLVPAVEGTPQILGSEGELP
jgi:hypothetical protein